MHPALRSGVWLPFSLAVLLLGGCLARSPEEVVVYSALDGEFSEPILQEFTRQSGIVVRLKLDAESTKTVGLTEAIRAEADRPRCDVFWNNEILNTLRLESAGLLEAYRSDAGEAFPPAFRSPRSTWHGFAARARVLVVNTRLAESDRPTSIEDLAASKWRGRAGLAKPLFGTTATHAACLFSVWGEARAKQFFTRVKGNDVRVLSGNKQVALAVAAGELDFGLTDTDDAIVEIERGKPVAIVYPDQAAGGLGTLFIPNTLAIIRGGPHPQAARRLVDYLLSPEVERKLAAGPSAQIPLNPAVDAAMRVATPKTVKPMGIDFQAAAAQWETAAAWLRDQFSAP